jgi:hypothetical protein
MKPRYIFLPLGIDPLPGFEHGIYPLRSEGCVGRFHKRLVRVGVAGTREVDLDPVLMSPQINRLAGEGDAVVGEQQLRYSPFLLLPIQRAHHIISLKTLAASPGTLSRMWTSMIVRDRTTCRSATDPRRSLAAKPGLEPSLRTDLRAASRPCCCAGLLL